MSPVTLLVSSAGRRVALIDCFRSDAADLGIDLRVVALDLRPEFSSACRRADVAYQAPPCTDSTFVAFVEQIVARESVRLIVPTIDTELSVYAGAAERFARLGAATNISGIDTIAVARDKAATARALHSAGISVPRTTLLEEFLEDQSGWRWPVILKPVSGSSSLGVRHLKTQADLVDLPVDKGSHVVQEFWEGREYTVNVFFDRAGRLRCAVPHWRMEVRGGEVSKGRTERVEAFTEIAYKMAGVLNGPRGALCYQAIRNSDGDVAVHEINARFGGGYPLAHAAGACFSRWLLEEATGRPSSASDEWREGVMMLRYDSAVFV